MKHTKETYEQGGFPKGPDLLLIKAALEKGEKAIGYWQTWCDQHDLETEVTLDRYRVLPLAHENLLRQAGGHPLQLPMGVEGAWKKTFFINNLLLRHLMKTQKMLNDQGIPVIVLKGMGMILSGIYPKMGSRFQFDYDILVPVGQKMEAVSLFEKSGGKPYYEGGREYHLNTSHSTGFTVPDLPSHGSIDVHWLPLAFNKHPGTNELYFREKVAVQFNGMQFFTVPPELHLIQTFLHGMKIEHTSHTQWVCDAAMIIRHSPDFDWVKFARLTEELKAGFFVKKGLQFLTDKIGIELPEAALQAGSSIRHTFMEPFIFNFYNKEQKGIGDSFFWKLFDRRQLYPQQSFLNHIAAMYKEWRESRHELSLTSFASLALNRLGHFFKNSSPDYQKKGELRA